MTAEPNDDPDDAIVLIADAETNIFAAMGLPDAEEMAEKADLVYEITRALRASGLNQSAAAIRIGITRADMSRILHGRTENISTTKLEAVLRGLGHDVIKVVVPTTRTDGRGSASVIGGETATAAVAAMGDVRTR